uniref:SCP domain-containing protein n=1 Tax=Chromera velia CCMP2878 TaxID=1169474 RepID=A0A0G4HDB0_9ALVE|eukprot:Cvel_6373.t1-p1 / transcript=Cvel_6373.t1 / gene=Cvel_6373 / organism=Chromera_velia_CCMP2878 / gene_product=Golgi-associated plant pathogenesis-related protein, putative / transcript_product=Golgi-associated plant pathogenesis-related protein, putative / location=Cvel_scaffold310:69341-71211(+) / protein_length=464 / sequence_SO=supercontig / SO=protein_coding / is_pseudo=false
MGSGCSASTRQEAQGVSPELKVSPESEVAVKSAVHGGKSATLWFVNASADGVPVDATVTVKWQVTEADCPLNSLSNYDYLALYKAGEADLNNYETYEYVPGTPSGSLEFTAGYYGYYSPGTQYDIRYVRGKEPQFVGAPITFWTLDKSGKSVKPPAPVISPSPTPVATTVAGPATVPPSIPQNHVHAGNAPLDVAALMTMKGIDPSTTNVQIIRGTGAHGNAMTFYSGPPGPSQNMQEEMARQQAMQQQRIQQMANNMYGEGDPRAQVRAVTTTDACALAFLQDQQELQEAQRTGASLAQSQEAFSKDLLQTMNQKRAMHGCPPLEWDDQLAERAHEWAKVLAGRLREGRGDFMEHGMHEGCGQNIAARVENNMTGRSAAAGWYSEVGWFEYDNADEVERAACGKAKTAEAQTGHFTQLVWKSSTKAGGWVEHVGGKTVIVCNFWPPGNVAGKFEANVPRPLEG